ncbi:DUF5677 domain-containing protein [Pseudoalteromonas sp. L1]|uniref:DUF5677 domain-containing protein n=1 Tax=Pseudoalteromonas sp. L1 TaxID=195716 RepID=UPI001F2028B4|nr:DUF5677 domain-containing protein [Pseudoalteromonas sp. L1]
MNYMEIEYITKNEFQNILKEAALLFQETYRFYYQNSEEGRLLYLSIKKLLNHCNSASVILNGTYFEAIENSDQVDHSSAKVLLRSALEIYVTLTSLYWFQGNENLREKEFRFTVFKYSGLKSRQKLNHNDISSDEVRKKISKEAIAMKNLKKVIESKGAELGKSKAHINKIIEKGWQARSITSRLEETSLPKFFKMQYSYLCGFSHSGYDSYAQLAEDENGIKKRVNTEMLYFLMSFLLAKLNQALLFNLNENVEVKTSLNETYRLLNKYDINQPC